jgi:hypothetical protein
MLVCNAVRESMLLGSECPGLLCNGNSRVVGRDWHMRHLRLGSARYCQLGHLPNGVQRRIWIAYYLRIWQ